MRSCFLCILALLLLSGCSTSGKLHVPAVCYQAIRTDFAQPSSIPSDAVIAVQYIFNTDGQIQPVVYNLTDDVLTIDQTKSFVIMPDGSSVSYFDPNVYTTSTGQFNAQTNTATFNLGALANVLGIGGKIGTLMGGTTLGTSTTTGTWQQNSVTISDQQLINVGPKGTICMSKAYKINGIGFDSALNLTANEYVDTPAKTAPLRFSVCVTYSADGGTTFDKLVTQFYVSSFIPEPVVNRHINASFMNIYSKKPDALAEDMFMFLLPNNIKRKSVTDFGDYIFHTRIYDNYIHGSLVDYK